MDRNISFGVACAALSQCVWNTIQAGSRLDKHAIDRLCEKSCGYIEGRTHKRATYCDVSAGQDERSVRVTFKQAGAPDYRALFRWPESARVTVDYS